MTKRLALATAALLLPASGASAIGFMTQMSCASDYYAYCSKFQVGSKELRICMRRAGPKLSKSCLNALIADGEVSKAEVEKTRQEILAAKTAAKQPPIKQKNEEQKQKRIAVAKADEAARNTEARPRGEKKSDPASETSHKTKKLTIDAQTFAALKQRQPKFIEEASAEDLPSPSELQSLTQSPTAKSTSADSEGTAAKGPKKKTARKSKAETESTHNKSIQKQAKLAAKKEKQRIAKRSKRLAGE